MEGKSEKGMPENIPSRARTLEGSEYPVNQLSPIYLETFLKSEAFLDCFVADNYHLPGICFSIWRLNTLNIDQEN